MKERYCFECGKRLDKAGFKFQNSSLSEDYLEGLWNHNSIEFYCCECFKEEMLILKGIVYLPNKSSKERCHISSND